MNHKPAVGRIVVERLDKEEVNKRRVFDWPIWEKEISQFDWTYDQQEQCYLIHGKVKVKTEESEVEIKSGDFVTFPAGLTCFWQVLEPVRKHYRFQ